MLLPERGEGAKRLGLQALQAAAGAPGRPSGWEDLRHRRSLLEDLGWDCQASGDLEAAPSVIAGHIRASNAHFFHAPPASGSVTKQEVYIRTTRNPFDTPPFNASMLSSRGLLTH